MDDYNIFIWSHARTEASVITNCLSEISSKMRPQVVLVNSDQKEKLQSQFKDLLGLKVEQLQGPQIKNLRTFTEEKPSEWLLIIRPNQRIITDPIKQYKKFWRGEVDKIYAPTDSRNFDINISGHLMFFNYYSYNKIDTNLDLKENIYELCGQGIGLRGVHGLASIPKHVEEPPQDQRENRNDNNRNTQHTEQYRR